MISPAVPVNRNKLDQDKSKYVILKHLKNGINFLSELNMLEEIHKGKSPSVVFRELIEQDPALTNIRLSQIFRGEFINVDGLAGQLIWHWKGPGKTQGMRDEVLNEELLRMLKEAGYIDKDKF